MTSRAGPEDQRSGEEPGAESGPKRTSGAKCPICGKPALQDYAPFCSRRCADVDLNRWLSGRYAVPGEPANSLPSGEDEQE